MEFIPDDEKRIDVLKDSYGRRINYLRISVTNRCNLRCIYCMPDDIKFSNAHRDILSFEEIQKIVTVAVSLGISKIRLTGGEPLVRKHIEKLIYSISLIKDIEYISMTTNGILLGKYAKALKQAGLQGINISLDSLNDNKFTKITKLGRLSDIIHGIDTALNENLKVKLNVVLIKNLNDDEIINFVNFAEKMNICVRFIEFMPVEKSSIIWDRNKIVSIPHIKEKIEYYYGKLISFESPSSLGNGPAEYYQTERNKVQVGFISATCNKFCSQCNRLRLTSEGNLKNCLYGKSELSVKEKLNSVTWYNDVRSLILKSIQKKPIGHLIDESGLYSQLSPQMSLIGG